MAEPNKGPDPTPSTAGKTVAGTRVTNLGFEPLPPQDLSRDPLLANLPRDGNSRPTLGGIPVLRKIGKGAMGAVYYAIHPRLGVEVAIKILPFHLAEQDPKIIDRFFSEGRMAASLESDHVVRVLDVNTEGETHYLVMQFIRGESVGQLVRRTKDEGKTGLPEADALRIVRAATRGLAVAHERGIIHRDVKPDNILIPNGNLDKAKLADLGLAKPEGGGGSVGTMSMVAMGTPGYMSPEQAEDAKTAGPAADVFAMGATLYALLVGRAPFAGTSVAVILRDTAMREPDLLPEGVSEKTRNIVAKCLAKDPAQRFANGSTLLAALEGKLSEDAYRPTVISAVRKKKPPSKAPLVGAIAAFLIAVGALVAWQSLKGSGQPTPPPVDPDAKAKALEKALNDARSKAEAGDFDGALAALKDLDSPEAARLRDEIAARAKTAREQRERAGKIAQALKNAETLEKDELYDAALGAINKVLADYPEEAALREAAARLKQKMDAARTGEQKAEAYRRWMEAAELQTITAEAKDTPDAWKAAIDASTKALSNALTDDEKRPAEEFLTRAQQRQSWILAKRADEAGDLAKALDLATTASGFRKAPKELADYLSTLQMRKKAADDRAARKAEFDRIAKLARDEKEPAKAADLWKQALDTADEPADATTAHTALETLAPEIARVEDEKRKAEIKRRAQVSIDDAETALKAGNFDLAEAKFKEAKPVLAAEADAGLGRVDAARRQKAYDDAIAEARDLQTQKQWARAKAACERALTIKQGDTVASDLLRAIEPNLIPEAIEVKLGGTAMKFVRIRPGTFTMGDPDFRKQGFEDAVQHEVTLTRDYWMLTTEVTQAQWEAVMGSNPSKFKGATLPVESISYFDAAAFVAKLNEKAADQLGRRKAAIPTEAEWEYAARGGTTTPWHFGASESAIADYGWVKVNAGGKTHPVAGKKPNAWGLYDVHGNVFEWCSDWNAPFTTAKATDPTGPGEGEYRGSRGGCYSYDAQFSRCGFRGKPEPVKKLDSLGLRILVK